ncbi:MAG: NAD/NADP octopine/nopaline dehydrogenase family protein [Lachnospiraceae bacterium]|nr:NAD/NADP octopine/nopaline dehydrogenase family protein [Lachnospiraceae bacterium]
MRITIVGGGNIGTQFAVHCAEKKHDVTVYTSTPEIYNNCLNIVDEQGITTHAGNIKLATKDPCRAFRDAELIMVTVPSTVMNAVADTIYDNTDSNPLIGVVPGNGGSECAFKRCIDRGNTFFGIERVPAIARLVQKGRTVRSTGYRDELHVAALPKSNGQRCAEIIESIFDKRCVVIPDFLNLTLTPSNPILHTTRLKTLFKDWKPGKTYASMPLFYEEWDDESSELLLACDTEVQEICKALPEFELNYVKSLRIHYESPTAEAMTRKLSSIQAFKGLPTPTVSVDGGVIPDLHSRYFTADFSYGLSIIKQVAVFAGVETPNIDETLNWYDGIAIEEAAFRFEDYGITDRASFDRFYLQ